MSIRLHVIQTTTFVLLGTLVIGALLIYWHSVRKIEIEMEAAISVGGRVARNAIVDFGEISNPRRRLVMLVADYNGDRHIRATLFGGPTNIIARSSLSAPEHPAPDWLHRLFEQPARITILKLPPQLAQHGRIVLHTDASNEIAEVWADAKLYLMLLASFCGSVLLILYFTLGRALAPLQSLLRGFEEIGHGDQPERIAVVGPTELSQLARGFNDMSDRLVGMKERNARLREQLETVQEEERAELARNLHDEISPLLFSVDVDATNVANIVDVGPAQDEISEHGVSSDTRRKIKKSTDAIKAAVSLLKRNVKGILGQLRPAGLHALNFKSTIEDLTTFWKARDASLEFSLTVPEKTWGVKIDSAVQSIVRESLSNAMKHGSPSKIDIRIQETRDNALLVEISDNGSGLKPTSMNEGLGVIGMRERAELLGGNLSLEDNKYHRGVRVHARIPLAHAHDEHDAARSKDETKPSTHEEEELV